MTETLHRLREAVLPRLRALGAAHVLEFALALLFAAAGRVGFAPLGPAAIAGAWLLGASPFPALFGALVGALFSENYAVLAAAALYVGGGLLGFRLARASARAGKTCAARRSVPGAVAVLPWRQRRKLSHRRSGAGARLPCGGGRGARRHGAARIYGRPLSARRRSGGAAALCGTLRGGAPRPALCAAHGRPLWHGNALFFRRGVRRVCGPLCCARAGRGGGGGCGAARRGLHAARHGCRAHQGRSRLRC